MQELKQIQEENRKAIIMACNPEAKSYEEALKMELKKLNNNPAREYILNGDEVFFINYELDDPYDNLEYMSSVDYFESQIITLNRVYRLIALSEKLYQLEFWQEIYKTELHFLKMVRYCDARIEESIIFKWDLTKETLEEQSKETQREINKFF